MNNHSSTTGSSLTREAIVSALNGLSGELGKQGVTGELCLFGGTVMVLVFTTRLATKDVDAIFEPAQLVRNASEKVALQQNLPSNWLNDGVKGFISAQHETTIGNLPQFAHLRLSMPVPEYLLAMKCMASRIGATASEQSDVPDIVFLLRNLGIRSAREALDIVARYYPANRISVKTQYLLEGLFDEGQV